MCNIIKPRRSLQQSAIGIPQEQTWGTCNTHIRLALAIDFNYQLTLGTAAVSVNATTLNFNRLILFK